jgi:hypothetical protein
MAANRSQMQRKIPVEILLILEWSYFLALFEHLFYLFCQDPECTKIGST